MPLRVVEVAPAISTSHQLARGGRPVEVDRLVVPRPAAQPRGSVRLGPSTSTSIVAADEALRPLSRAALDQLDQALHPLALDRVRQLVVHRRRLGFAARREDEGEGAVVADLLDDLERLLEVRLGLAREADDDVGGDRAVGHVLADQRHPVHVALAVVGAPHPLQHRRWSPTAAAGGCARRATGARRGRGSRPRACPSGAGSCSGSARSRRPRRPARAARRSRSASPSAGRARSC